MLFEINIFVIKKKFQIKYFPEKYSWHQSKHPHPNPPTTTPPHPTTITTTTTTNLILMPQAVDCDPQPQAITGVSQVKCCKQHVDGA